MEGASEGITVSQELELRDDQYSITTAVLSATDSVTSAITATPPSP
jgi:hypothetical protein